MKIHFVTEGTLNEFWDAGPASGCDVLFFGFNGLGEVDYRSELDGGTSKLEDAAILSRELGCVVVSGCYTDSCGIRRKSAVVAEKGRILGVSDMLNTVDTSDFKSGGALRVYNTSAGKHEAGKQIWRKICISPKSSKRSRSAMQTSRSAPSRRSRISFRN